MRRSPVLLAVLATALAGSAFFAAAASATPGPVSGDDRATAHSGNKVEKDCPTLFPGSTAVARADLTFSVDGTNTYLDITAVKDGVEVAGVIVKGGPAYNVYRTAKLGDLAWLDLHSPLVPSGKPAQISHWFACGVTDSTTTTTTTTTKITTTTTTTGTSSTTSTTSTTDSTDTTTTTSGRESSTTGATSTPVTTTTSAAVAPAADDDDLASTGFNGGWLIALAAVLLLGGAALLILVRTRAARR